MAVGGADEVLILGDPPSVVAAGADHADHQEQDEGDYRPALAAPPGMTPDAAVVFVFAVAVFAVASHGVAVRLSHAPARRHGLAQRDCPARRFPAGRRVADLAVTGQR